MSLEALARTQYADVARYCKSGGIDLSQQAENSHYQCLYQVYLTILRSESDSLEWKDLEEKTIGLSMHESHIDKEPISIRRLRGKKTIIEEASSATSKDVGITLLRSLYTPDELMFLQSTRQKDRRHPLQRLFFPQDRDASVVENTDLALKTIFERDDQWIRTKKKKLVSSDSFETASSLLGEIRAYGSLLSIGLEPRLARTGQQSAPDFLVEKMVLVEVHTKQSEPSEAYAMEQFNQSEVRRRISGNIHPTSPFGSPRRDDSVTRIAIQKLAQIKQKEEERKKQFSSFSPSILWLDFQDETWKLIVSASDAEPVTLWNDEYYSGTLWYAFYGWKSAPVFEGQTKVQRRRRVAGRMAHDGRFRRKTNIDAVVVSFPNDTIVLENPFSQKRIPPSILEKIALLPNFNPDHSFINLPHGELTERIASQRTSLEALANEAVYGW